MKLSGSNHLSRGFSVTAPGRLIRSGRRETAADRMTGSSPYRAICNDPNKNE